MQSSFSITLKPDGLVILGDSTLPAWKDFIKYDSEQCSGSYEIHLSGCRSFLAYEINSLIIFVMFLKNHCSYSNY